MKSHLSIIILLALLASCVPKADLMHLAQEKEDLENEVSRLNETIRKNTQLRSELINVQKEAQAEKEVLTQEKEEALNQVKAVAEELEALKRTFEKFKVDRRNGMIGKKIPEIVLKTGKKLINAEIKEVSAATVRFGHSAGAAVVRLADLDPDLQWEAVWDVSESKKYEEMMDRKKNEDSQEFKTYLTIQSAKLETQKLQNTEKRVVELEKLIETLRIRLENQRAELNAAYQKLNARSGIWDSVSPENSEMFTDWKKLPRTMGIGQLEGLANSIRTIKESGAAATSELARLREVLDNSKK